MFEIGSSPQRSGVFGQQVKIESGARELCLVFSEQAHDLAHARNPERRERSRDDGLFRIAQDHVQPPGVGDVLRDVFRDERGGEIRYILQPVRDLHVVDEVGRVGLSNCTRLAIENAKRRRRGHEVHVITFERRVWVSVAVIERERGRRGVERFFDDLAREGDAARLFVSGETHVDESLECFVMLDEDAGVLENRQSLVDNPLHQGGFEDLHACPHGTLFFRAGSKKGRGTTLQAARRRTYSTVNSTSSAVPCAS